MAKFSSTSDSYALTMQHGIIVPEEFDDNDGNGGKDILFLDDSYSSRSGLWRFGKIGEDNRCEYEGLNIGFNNANVQAECYCYTVNKEDTPYLIREIIVKSGTSEFSNEIIIDNSNYHEMQLIIITDLITNESVQNLINVRLVEDGKLERVTVSVTEVDETTVLYSNFKNVSKEYDLKYNNIEDAYEEMAGRIDTYIKEYRNLETANPLAAMKYMPIEQEVVAEEEYVNIPYAGTMEIACNNFYFTHDAPDYATLLECENQHDWVDEYVIEVNTIVKNIENELTQYTKEIKDNVELYSNQGSIRKVVCRGMTDDSLNSEIVCDFYFDDNDNIIYSVIHMSPMSKEELTEEELLVYQYAGEMSDVYLYIFDGNVCRLTSGMWITNEYDSNRGNYRTVFEEEWWQLACERIEILNIHNNL